MSMHCFECLGEYFLYDIESGALHVVDRIVYDYLQGDISCYSKNQIDEVIDELQQLTDNGLLYTNPPQVPRQIKERVIKSLCLHVSHDCNLRCKYCFAGQGAYHGDRLNMSIDIALASIDFLIANSGTRHNLEVDFFGGEPLLNLDVLKKTVEYANAQGAIYNKQFLFTTTTNGLLLNKETSDYLNQTMENVVLSLDGRKSVNDELRVTAGNKGSYDLIVDKYRYFRSIRGNKSYYVRGTFTALNLDFCADVLHIADLGFDQISLEPVVLSKGDVLEIRQEHLQTIFRQYEILAKEYIERRQNGRWFSFFHFVLDLENSPCYKKKLSGCGAGVKYLAVAPNGDIYPCHQFVGEKEYCMGNVQSGVIDESIRDIFASTDLTTKPKCASCWAKYHCSGGCNANAIHFNNDISVPYEISCEIFKKRLECALYIYSKAHE